MFSLCESHRGATGGFAYLVTYLEALFIGASFFVCCVRGILPLSTPFFGGASAGSAALVCGLVLGLSLGVFAFVVGVLTDAAICAARLAPVRAAVPVA